MKVLFVCYGNIGRSQMAESYYNSFTDSHDAKSAGVSPNAGLKYHHPATDIINLMKEDGIDISSNIVKAVDESMINDAERVVVMCDIDDCPSYIVNSKKTVHKPVSDPYGLDIEYARSVRNDIKNMVLDIIHDKP